MNKMVKGSVAGAAGVALLMGGFGTYAVWSDSATLKGGTITAGTLELGKPSEPEWHDVSSGVAKQIDINEFRVVPGDKLEMTQTLSLKAVGNNIAGVVSFEPGGPISNWGGELTYDVALSDAAGNFDFRRDSGTASASVDDTWSFTGGGEEPVTVTVTVDFTNATDGNSQLYRNASTALAGAQIVVTQTR